MKKIYQHDEFFSFLSGIIVSFACTVLYEVIVNLYKWEIRNSLIFLSSSLLMFSSSILLMLLSIEAKDLCLRFEQIRNENNVFSINALWERVFIWKAEDEIKEKNGEEATSGQKKEHARKIRNKLDFLFYMAISMFAFSMCVLVLGNLI